MNENWPRWIFASVTTHFDDNLGTYEIFYEGQKRNAENYKTDLFEVRMDGPYFLQLSPNLYDAKIEVNLLVQAAMDDVDFHKIHKMVGVAAKGFAKSIPVLQYGDGEAQVGCLDLMQDRRNREYLVISHFGQIDPDKQLLQATVEGHYQIQLTG